MQDNIGSLGRDFIADLGFTHTELVGKDIKKTGKNINTLPNIYDNKDSRIRTGYGDKHIKYGNAINKVGKYGGKSYPLVGFALGYHDDITAGKTNGEAIAHNSLTVGAGAVAGTSAGILLGTNPVGWGILTITGIGIGIGVSTVVDMMYKNNTLGLRDKTDDIGRKLDKYGHKVQHNIKESSIEDSKKLKKDINKKLYQ
ncbi:hypothetical protein [Staphylococcus pettenkoferi]